MQRFTTLWTIARHVDKKERDPHQHEKEGPYGSNDVGMWRKWRFWQRVVPSVHPFNHKELHELPNDQGDADTHDKYEKRAH